MDWWVTFVLYRAFKKFVGIFFNVLNILLLGNLPPFGTVCILVEQDGQYLVVERPEGPIVLPGGFMRWNELSTQTAQREGKEETGLDLEVGEIITSYTKTAPDFTSMSTIIIVHKARIISGELRGSIEGQPQWIDKSILPGLLAQHYQPIVKYL